jgi:hypothetical protein
VNTDRKPFRISDLIRLFSEFINGSNAAMLQTPTGALDGSNVSLSVTLIAVEETRLTLDSVKSIPEGKPVAVTYGDAMFLGEATACEVTESGLFRIEISVEQILTALQSLKPLRRALLAPTGSRDPSFQTGDETVSRFSSAPIRPRRKSKPYSDKEVQNIANSPAVGVLMAAAAAFQDVETGRSWLSTPRVSLGGKTPLTLIATDEGRQVVLNELGLIQNGMF